MSKKSDRLTQLAVSILEGVRLVKGQHSDTFCLELLCGRLSHPALAKAQEAYLAWERQFPGVPLESTLLICRGLVKEASIPGPKPGLKQAPSKPSLKEAILTVMAGVAEFRAPEVLERLAARGWQPVTKNNPVCYVSYALGRNVDTFERIKHGVYRVRAKSDIDPEKPVDLPPLAKQLKDTFEQHPTFTAQQAANLLGVPGSTISGSLVYLQRLGLLEKVGSEKPTLWRFLK